MRGRVGFTPPSRKEHDAGVATPRRPSARRLGAFPGHGTPPAGVACDLLCEDHVGTYALPYPLVRGFMGARRDGRARKSRRGRVAGKVATRLTTPTPELRQITNFAFVQTVASYTVLAS
jgi:hypothetical protein